MKKQGDLTVYSVPVTKGDVTNAHALQTSAGKFYLIEQLGESVGETEPFNPKDWVGKSVREIIAETKENPNSQKNMDRKTDPAAIETPKPKQNNTAGGKNETTPYGGGQIGSPAPDNTGGKTREPGGANPAGGGNHP